jgi:uncharacterized membrane protein
VEWSAVFEFVAYTFEFIGVAILVIGGVWTVYRALKTHREGGDVYSGVRRDFGRSLLLGLEVLVAADIVRTVTVEITLNSVLVLGILVLVRTLLSFSLEVEIDGIVPWRKAATTQQSS